MKVKHSYYTIQVNIDNFIFSCSGLPFCGIAQAVKGDAMPPFPGKGSSL